MRARLVLALLLTGCFERSLQPVDPCTQSRQGTISENDGIDKVDLLLMIDNSNSMVEEQASVVDQVPRIVRILTSGDRDGDGVQDFMPARSLHIGIVDSDMGVGDVMGVASCDAGFGDDGLMQIAARHPAAGCSGSYASTYGATPNVFDFTVGGPRTPDQFAMDVACVATLGTDGCGFEHELESPLKALSLTPTADGSSPVAWTHPGYRPPTFWGDTFGHGSDPSTNGAFLRPDSALAIITINDEDDCSTGDPHIFSLDDPMYASSPLNLRCHTFGDRLYPLSRYADGFLGLRNNPTQLIYGAITGIPPALAGSAPATILADPAMEEMVDATGQQLLPSCVSPGGRGVAYPARRMTELGQLLEDGGAAVSIQSICNTDFSGAFDAIIAGVIDAISGVCLARELNPDGDGNVPCDVLEVLPEGQHCAELDHPEAYVLDHIETSATAGEETQREVCRVHQVGRIGAGVTPGWAYDQGDVPGWSQLPAGCTQRIGFSVVEPVLGAEVRLECSETILPSTHALAQLGTVCDPQSDATCAQGTAVPGNPAPLSCDPFTRACGIACTADADCVSAGLLSYVCDTRTASTYFASMPSDLSASATHGFCVNPTCGR